MKTRLIPAVGAEAAARLSLAFLDDTVESARGLQGVELELWGDTSSGEPGFFKRRYADLPVKQQTGGDLGARLARAFDSAFADGVDYAVIIGADHPTLPVAYIERAFRALIGSHLVIGPSRDGGYYLVGLRRYAWPNARGLFEAMPWSTPDLLAATREAALRLGLCHVELPEWYDVDEPADLERLRLDVAPGSRAARALARMRPEPTRSGGD